MSKTTSNIIFLTGDEYLRDNRKIANRVLSNKFCSQHCFKCSLYPSRSFVVSSLVKFDSGFLYTNRGNFKISYSAGRALCLLQRNTDDFVSKDDIMKYVWGDYPRVENNVNVVISELRTALTSTGVHILNQRKVGYMLTEVGF